MSLQKTNCSICRVYEPCYHVCCMVVYLCGSCLMDSDILANNNECPECYRSLDAVYHSLVNKARYREGINGMRQKSFANKNYENTQTSQQKSLMRNQFNFQDSRHEVEEEFEFAETLHQRQSQVKKFRNDFSSHLRSNTHQHQQQNFHHQGMNNSFVQSKPFAQQMNQANTPFNPRNNFKSNQFNPNRNNGFENSGCYDENPYQPNMGFQHQNEMNMNNSYQRQGYGLNYEGENGGFNQNIRQSRPFNQNNNFQQNRFQNNFGNKVPYQNEQQMNFGTEKKKTNPFAMWNQQKQNNMNQNQFNTKNQTNFTQGYGQSDDTFQFQDNSFQSSHERLTKSVGKVNQLKRVNTFNHQNGTSSSFKIDNHGNHSNSDKEHSPTFGREWSNEQSFGGAIVPYGSQMQGGRQKMEIEQEDATTLLSRTKSHDSLVTLGRRDLSQE